MLALLLCTGMASSLSAQNSPAQILPKALIPYAQHRTIAGKDTVIESDTSKETKEPRYYYLSVNADVMVNTKGGAAKRFAPAIELGRTYGIFDIGLATGRTNSSVPEAILLGSLSFGLRSIFFPQAASPKAYAWVPVMYSGRSRV